jgi:hypothetical protein
MVKLSNARQSPDIFGISRDGFPDHFHLRVVPLESLIMVLLTRGHLMLAISHLFENAFYAIKPLATVRHVERLCPQLSIDTRKTFFSKQV